MAPGASDAERAAVLRYLASVAAPPPLIKLDLEPEPEQPNIATAVLSADGTLAAHLGPLPASPQYHGDRTKSAASPRVHPRWKSPREPPHPETIAAPIGAKLVSPWKPEPVSPPSVFPSRSLALSLALSLSLSLSLSDWLTC